MAPNGQKYQIIKYEWLGFCAALDVVIISSFFCAEFNENVSEFHECQTLKSVIKI